MGLLATVLGALGVSEAAGLVGPVLNRADHLLFDRFGSDALKDIQARLSGVLTDIPPNHDLENAIRLAGVTAGLILLQQVRSELEADQFDTRSAKPLPPFLDEARRWLHDQLAIRALLNGQTNTTLLRELERDLDAVLAAHTPETVRESLTDAETTMWEALTGGVAAQGGGVPPDGFADRFHGRVAGKPGWTTLLHALLREALKNDPDARIAFLTTRLGTLSTAMPSLMTKIETMGARIDALNVEMERRDRQTAAERERQEQAANRQDQQTQQKLDSQNAKLDLLLARAAEHHISEATVRGIVERLGGLNITGGDLIPWLENWIEHARIELDLHSNEGAAYDAAWRKAQALFNDNRLAEVADPFMEELRREESREAERLSERRRHRVALLEAAIDFDTRALNIDAIPPKLRLIAAENGVTDPDALGRFLHDRAREHYDYGRDKGDNAALLVAIATWRTALQERTRARVPRDWAITQINLGNALSILGERESGTMRLEQAVTAFRDTLEEYTRRRAPLEWAMIQNNLGNALAALGERENGTARLEQAVTAFRAALKEYTLARAPLRWAMTHNNLGNALLGLGQRQIAVPTSAAAGKRQLKAAVTTFRAALQVRTREHVPQQWAMTQNNLGNVLLNIGQHESGTTQLEEAVTAYRAALEVRTREHVPLQWAMTQNNLGNALFAIGQRLITSRTSVEAGKQRLIHAVTAYLCALEEHTRTRVPLQWAFSQHTLSAALALLATLTHDRALLVEARSRMRDAAEVYREGGNSYWLPEAKERIAAIEADLAAWPAP